MRLNTALITSLLFANFMSAVPALAANYNFTDLGSLVQYYDVNDVNNIGQVVGYTNSKAFLSIDGNMQFIGNLGSTFSYAYGINNSGQIVGNADTAGAFIYSNGNMQALGTLGGLVSKAYGINDSGQVVGVSATSDNSTHAFLYSNGSMQDLGTLGGTYSAATAINNGGQVVGDSATQDNSTHAFLYSNGSIQDLGTLGGSGSFATGINDNSQVVGNSYDFFDVNPHAFLYSNGSMQDLGTLGGNRSYANSINNSGQVVGSSTFREFNLSSDPSNHAFLYSNGSMSDLNSFLDAATLDAGWILESAEAINDNGWIVGFAYNRVTSQSHAYLLSVASVPEPETYAMFLAGLALMGFAVRRSQLS
jgi:probable HAF family extracellular repeat protein